MGTHSGGVPGKSNSLQGSNLKGGGMALASDVMLFVLFCVICLFAVYGLETACIG